MINCVVFIQRISLVENCVFCDHPTLARETAMISDFVGFLGS